MHGSKKAQQNRRAARKAGHKNVTEQKDAEDAKVQEALLERPHPNRKTGNKAYDILKRQKQDDE